MSNCLKSFSFLDTSVIVDKFVASSAHYAGNLVKRSRVFVLRVEVSSSGISSSTEETSVARD
jgi:hypothetical protein